MEVDITQYLIRNSEFSIISGDGENFAAKDKISPFSFIDFIKYFNLKSESEFKYFDQYNNYLKLWYETKDLTASEDLNTYRKEKYIEFLKDIEVNYLNDDERRIISNLDYTDANSLDIAIPYFVDKIKEIILYYSNKRETVESVIEKWKKRGTDIFITNEIKEYILNNFTNKYSILKKEDSLEDLSVVASELLIDIEELFDYNNNYENIIDNRVLLSSGEFESLSAYSEYNTTSKSNLENKKDFILKNITSDLYLLSTYGSEFKYAQFQEKTGNNYNHYNIKNAQVALSSNPSTLKKRRYVQKWFKPNNLRISEYISDTFYFKFDPLNFFDSIPLDESFIDNIDSTEIYGTLDDISIVFVDDYDKILGVYEESGINFERLSQVLSLSSIQISENLINETIISNPLNFDNPNFDIFEFDDFIKAHYTDGEMANKPIMDKKFRRFYPYTSRSEKNDAINHGLSRTSDSIDFWDKDFWKNSDVYEKYNDLALNKDVRIKDLLYIDSDKELYRWTLDVFGNEYGLIKKKKLDFFEDLESVFTYDLSSFNFNPNSEWLDFYTEDFRFVTLHTSSFEIDEELFNTFTTLSSIQQVGLLSSLEISSITDQNFYLIDINGNFLTNTLGEYLVLSAGEVVIVTQTPLLSTVTTYVASTNNIGITKNTYECVLYDYFRVIDAAVSLMDVLSSYPLGTVDISKYGKDVPIKFILECFNSKTSGYWNQEYEKLNIKDLFYYEREYSNFNTLKADDPDYSYHYTISEKENITGTPYYRNLYSNIIDPLSSLYLSDDFDVIFDVHNNTIDLNMYYDFMVCRTLENIYFSNISFNYYTGEVNTRAIIKDIRNYNSPLTKTGKLFYDGSVLVPEISGVTSGTHVAFIPTIREVGKDLSVKSLYDYNRNGVNYFRNYPYEVDLVECDKPTLSYNDKTQKYYMTINTRDVHNNQYQFIHEFSLLKNGLWNLDNTKFIRPYLMKIHTDNVDAALANSKLSAYESDLSSFVANNKEIYWNFELGGWTTFDEPVKNERYIFTLQDDIGMFVRKNTYEYDLSLTEFYDLTLSTYNDNALLYVIGDEASSGVFGVASIVELLGLFGGETVLGDLSLEDVFGRLQNPNVFGVYGQRRKPFVGPCKINMGFNKLTDIVSKLLNGHRVYRIDLFVNGVKEKTLTSQLETKNVVNVENNSFEYSPLNLEYSEIFEPNSDGSLKEYVIQVDYYTIENGKVSTTFNLDIIPSSIGEYFADIDLLDTEILNVDGKNYMNIVYNTKLPSYVYKQQIEL